MDTRQEILLRATTKVRIQRANREQWPAKNSPEYEKRRREHREAKRAKRLANRKAWLEWTEVRGVIQKLAKMGRHVMPPAAHGPGTRACYTCNVPQPIDEFEPDAEARFAVVCRTCKPQVYRVLAAQVHTGATARTRASMMKTLLRGLELTTH